MRETSHLGANATDPAHGRRGQLRSRVKVSESRGVRPGKPDKSALVAMLTILFLRVRSRAITVHQSDAADAERCLGCITPVKVRAKELAHGGIRAFQNTRAR